MDSMKIILFFSWRISLKDWVDKGLFDREIKPYHSLDSNNIYYFFTYGDSSDETISVPQNIVIVPFLRRPICSLKLLMKADIYKTNQIWGSWVAVLLALIFRKKLWVRAGYDHYKNHLARNSNLIKRSFSYLVSKFAYRNANIITVTSKDVADFVAKTFKVTPSKIFTHSNYIDTSEFRVKTEILKREKSILYVGRLNTHKNIIMLLHSMVGLNIDLNIVGSGECETEIRKKAKELRIDVKFLGIRPNHELPEIYNQFRYFCLPSLFEGNPKVLLEAMACGCVVIVNNIDAHREIVSNNLNGYLVDANLNFSNDVIRIFEKDDIKLKTISEKAFEYIYSNCSLKSYMDFEQKIVNLVK
jgi:glycosyltransferase involved in cell wall biosynthesis